MYFDSFAYFLFLPVVWMVYWLIPSRASTGRRMWLLAVSYFFYACWDVRFLALLIFSTALDYFSGWMIGDSDTSWKRKMWLWISIVVNLGFLGFFKYYNFFVVEFQHFTDRLGWHFSASLLEVVLPVGISFYTFHGLSYVIDIYYKRIEVEKDPWVYGLFVSYFPLLVAGPIERAHHLIPQIKALPKWDMELAKDGLRQIMWGILKKVIVADQCALWANEAFLHVKGHHSWQLTAGMVAFAFQIYADFSGYSDVALGSSKLFGIRLLKNFKFPYFSRDIAEFWRRWHVSLSSWFRDYVYIPLGGSKGGKLQQIRNVFIIFILSGFWHGANITFVVWGALHALYYMPLMWLQRHRKHTLADAQLRGGDLLSMLITFAMVNVAWVFFRAENMGQAIGYLKVMVTGGNSKVMDMPDNGMLVGIGIAVLLAVEWWNRTEEHGLVKLKECKPVLRWAVYTMGILVFMLFAGKHQPFIYFQF